MSAVFVVPEPRNEPLLSFLPPSAERKAHKAELERTAARIANIPLVIAGDQDGIDAALDAVRDLMSTARGAGPSPAEVLKSGLARHGTAVLLRLGVRPDGDALAEDPALSALWPALEFHPELAARATALLCARRGVVADLLRQHLSGHQRELWDYLLGQLALGGEEAGDGLVLDALLELGERA